MLKEKNLAKQFGQALLNLKNALDQPLNEYMRDSSIKRFEILFDLSWKLVKSYLEQESGIVVHSPKGVFREAFQQGIIPYDEYWLEIVDLRNHAVHIYSQEMAEQLFESLPKVLSYIETLKTHLKTD